ncbi:MAG TPA: NAD(P)-dependent oxidoreductase, partial [Candidatus Latescibacteria bacterium]|nr:NAD(P)-dependent oxidoreductase [Candidatus Latescibacterota bacterium]
MHVAVTGAAGRLGRALLPKLAAQHQVLATDLIAHPGDPPIEVCNVLDPTAANALSAAVDAVVHLAAVTWRDDLSPRENETLIF